LRPTQTAPAEKPLEIPDEFRCKLTGLRKYTPERRAALRLYAQEKGIKERTAYKYDSEGETSEECCGLRSKTVRRIIEARMLREKGYTVSEIAEMFNVHRSTVHDYLKADITMELKRIQSGGQRALALCGIQGNA
jgi:DNA invertase Pin-like site-specific DNA recombinase